MCHIFSSYPIFLNSLLEIDRHIASLTQMKGCSFCGGPLHYSNYERKPRGITHDQEISFCLRFSLCCAREGCRKRHTPPSVRFLGRRVYLGVIVVLAAVLQQGLADHTEKYLRQFNIHRQTLHHWMKWWKNKFPLTSTWRQLKGTFPTAVNIPLDPLLAMSGSDIDTKMRRWLFQLIELTTPWSKLSMGLIYPHNF